MELPWGGMRTVPTYMDMHDIPGVKAADVVGAHEADLKVQGNYGVNYKHYWVDEAAGKVFCLVDAPDKESAARVPREAHGLEAHTLFEVSRAPDRGSRRALQGFSGDPRAQHNIPASCCYPRPLG